LQSRRFSAPGRKIEQEKKNWVAEYPALWMVLMNMLQHALRGHSALAVSTNQGLIFDINDIGGAKQDVVICDGVLTQKD
jgi:hypothetical protein